jgi:Holliday junction resolvasome RuvABC endonuclease subunit
VSAAEPAVVGLDLSLRHTAIATTDGKVHVIEGAAVRDDDPQGAMDRLEYVCTQITNIIYAGPPPELAVIEGYSFGSSTKGVRAMAELGGCVRRGLWRLAVPYLEVPPTTLKKYATGNGKAGKYDVIKAAGKHLGYDGTNDNEADALWLRAIGCELLAVPQAKLAKVNVSAIAALRKVRPVLEGRDR